eukprot:1101761-Pyramimonas_sp.AAC.1
MLGRCRAWSGGFLDGVGAYGVGGLRRIGDRSAIHRRRQRGERRDPHRAAPPMDRRCGAILRPHLGGL